MSETGSEYRDRLAVVIYQAIVEGSRDEKRVPTVNIVSAFDALTLVGAILISRAAVVDTPPKMRKFCSTLASNFQKQLKSAQKSDATARQFESR